MALMELRLSSPISREPMPFSVSARRSKLAATLVLCCLGLLFASTAATVLAAGETQRRVAASAPDIPTESATIPPSVEAISYLVDSLVEPLFTGNASRAANGYAAGNPTVRRMLDLLMSDTTDAAAWDQYTTVNELLAGMRMGDERLRAFDVMWHTNLHEADSALVHGDAAEAIRRARENIVSARWLLQKPSMRDARVGRDMLVDAAQLLGRSALQDDQPFLNTAAERLSELALRARLTLGTARVPSWQWGANVDDAKLLAIASDHSLLPAVRVASLTSVLAGSCLREREVLFGPSSKRLRTMMALGLAIRDLPRGEILAGIHRESLLRMEDPNPSMRLDTTDSPAISATITRLMIPASVHARVQLCRTIV